MFTAQISGTVDVGSVVSDKYLGISNTTVNIKLSLFISLFKMVKDIHFYLQDVEAKGVWIYCPLGLLLIINIACLKKICFIIYQNYIQMKSNDIKTNRKTNDL